MNTKRPHRALPDGLDLVWDISSEALVTIGDDLRIIRANPCFVRLVGFAETELSGRRLKDFLSTDLADSPMLDEFFRRAEQSRLDINIVDSEKRKKLVSIQCKRFVPHKKNGAFLLLVLNETGRHTTARAAAGTTVKNDAELREVIKSLVNIFESQLDGIMVSDSSGHITRVNKALTRLVGYSRKEILGSTPMMFTHFDEGTHPTAMGTSVEIDAHYFKRLSRSAEQLFSKGEIDAWEAYYKRKDGILVPVEQSIVFLHDRKGSRVGSVGIIRDNTKRTKTINELKETRDFLDNLIESSLDAILISDSSGTITRANRAVVDLLGYEKEELLHKTTFMLSDIGEGVYESTAGERVVIDKSFFDSQHRIIERLLDKGRISNWKTYFIRKDRKLVPVEQNIVLLRNLQRDMIGAFGIIRDATETRRTEIELQAHQENLNEMVRKKTAELSVRDQELQASELRYRQLVDTMNEGLLIRDKIGICAYVNDRFCKMLGYSRSEIIGKPVTYFLDERNRQVLQAELERRKKGQTTAYEINWKKKDGSDIVTLVSPRPLFDKNGVFEASFAVVSDITSRKLAEQEIRNARDFLENVFRTTLDGIIVTDHMGTIIRINRAVEKMLGYRGSELIGRHITELGSADNAHMQRGRHMLEQLLEKGSVENWETEWHRKDGSICFVECSISYVLDHSGTPIHSVAAVRDISERKQIEAQMLQVEKLKSLGELAGGVAHDFNNVLTAVLGRAQLMKRELEAPNRNAERRRSSPRIMKGLETIERAALDGAETVRRIQEFSRKSDGDRKFTGVDLKKIIRGAVEFTRARWKDDAEARGIRYHIYTRLTNLPPVAGNEAELREVFTNLINNALDAMPGGGSLSFTGSLRDQTVHIKVRDTGQGISAEVRDRIYDPFFTTKGPQSTGLGMSVSYGIVSRHNGTISLESREGRGTTFLLTFPVAGEAKASQPKAAGLLEQQAIKILIIDDERDVLELLHDVLQTGGHTAVAASSGPEGIDIFRNDHFDIVFTDLGMPEMSGWQVADEIKKLSPATPVVLITGWEMQNQKKKLARHGIDLVLNKPFQITQILQIVHQAVQLNSNKKSSG